MNRILVLILAFAIAFCSACTPQKQESQATETPSEPPPVLVNIDGEPMAGDPTAEVIVVEFVDYQCPVCGRQIREIMPQLQANYIDTGRIAYVFKDFPAERWHPRALQAAEAVHCAADQGQFMEMHDLLLLNQNALQEDALYDHAETLSLDISTFQDCMITNKHVTSIRSDFEEGESLGITGTPTFYIGVREPGQPGTMRVISIIRGVGAYPSFSQKIEGVMASLQ